jgi:putative glutamine transport system substrate-binding protein
MHTIRAAIGPVALTLALAVLAGCAAGPATPAAKAPAAEAKPAAAAQPAPPAAQPAKPAAAPAQPAASAPSFPPDSSMAKIVQRGKLLVGIKYDVPLYGYLNPKTNQVEGFDAEIGREIARALFGDPTKVEFRQATSQARIPMLKEGVVDVVLATMTITKDRMKEIDFSHVYYESGQTVLVPENSPIKKPEDVAGKTIAMVKGGTGELNLRKLFPTARPLLFDTHGDSFEAVRTGRADGMWSDETILRGLMTKAPGFRMVPGRYTYEPYGVGIQKGHPEFVAFVNKVITDIKKSSRWKEIWRQTIGGEPPDPPADEPDLNQLP